jgi:transketolase
VLNIRPLRNKFASFGWSVVSLNGHDHSSLLTALGRIPRKKGKPTAIIARTIAGKGVGFMEGKLEWHYRNLDDKLFRLSMEAIQK